MVSVHFVVVTPASPRLPEMRVELFTIMVREYDKAIEFFTDVLGFDLVEDSPSLTNDGRPKRWVVVRPPGAETGILLARADGEDQSAGVGNQLAGRVGFFLRVDDFTAAYERMAAAGVEFVTSPRTEPYGQVAVFLDVAGNRWDLLGPPAPTRPADQRLPDGLPVA
jgi:catechol 2,3-dioxygenase-like lactoylglutathione lyase family enzyme